jgi:hypothetical protein
VNFADELHDLHHVVRLVELEDEVHLVEEENHGVVDRILDATGDAVRGALVGHVANGGHAFDEGGKGIGGGDAVKLGLAVVVIGGEAFEAEGFAELVVAVNEGDGFGDEGFAANLVDAPDGGGHDHGGVGVFFALQGEALIFGDALADLDHADALPGFGVVDLDLCLPGERTSL